MGILIFSGLFMALFLTDIIFKQRVEDQPDESWEHELLEGKIILRKVHNKGFALNVLEKYPDVVKVVSATLGVCLTVYHICLLFHKKQHVKKVGVTLLLSGAWSNIYDRLLKGYVVDYFGFKTKWKKLSNITFNLGDMFIFAGSILILLTALFKKK